MGKFPRKLVLEMAIGYGHHLHTCPLNPSASKWEALAKGGSIICTCGFDAVLGKIYSLMSAKEREFYSV